MHATSEQPFSLIVSNPELANIMPCCADTGPLQSSLCMLLTHAP